MIYIIYIYIHKIKLALLILAGYLDQSMIFKMMHICIVKNQKFLRKVKVES